MGEEARGDLVGFLRLLVRRRRGDEDQAARSGFLRARDVEGRGRTRSLAAGDDSRLAGIEEADAHVGGCVLQRRAQIGERQARVAQPQIAVLGVSRVVDEEQRLLAAIARGLRARRELVEPAEDLARIGVGEQARVLLANSAEAGEDAMDAPRIAFGVAQRAGAGATVGISHHEREAAHLRAGGPGHREDRERRRDALHRLPLTSGRAITSEPSGTPAVPCSATARRTDSASSGWSERTVTRVALLAGPTHSNGARAACEGPA